MLWIFRVRCGPPRAVLEPFFLFLKLFDLDFLSIFWAGNCRSYIDIATADLEPYCHLLHVRFLSITWRATSLLKLLHSRHLLKTRVISFHVPRPSHRTVLGSNRKFSHYRQAICSDIRDSSQGRCACYTHERGRIRKHRWTADRICSLVSITKFCIVWRNAFRRLHCEWLFELAMLEHSIAAIIALTDAAPAPIGALV